MVDIHSAISSVLTNKRRIGALKKLGVITIADAIGYYPFRATNRVPVKSIDDIKIGENVAFSATVMDTRVTPMSARNGYRVEVRVSDGSRVDARLVYFTYKKYYVSYITNRLYAGAQLAVQGMPSEYGGFIQFTHPQTCVVRDDSFDVPRSGEADTIEEAIDRLSRPRPVYHANSTISSEHIHESIVSMLKALAGEMPTIRKEEDASPEVLDESIVDIEKLCHVIPDVIPESVRAQRNLLHKAEAIIAIHLPSDEQNFNRGIETLRYEEALISQTAMVKMREDNSSAHAYSCVDEQGYVERLISSLPFKLTGGQQDVIKEITRDMTSGKPMSRLLQGEVGSGKTIVALAALLQAVGAGKQAVIVAPTQVLAQQHIASISNMLTAAGLSEIPIVLLHSGMKLAERRRALSIPASGVPCIVVATHAAFAKTFQAPHLAIAVIDEQHRFGVEQREILRSEINTDGMVPHMLVMTATPIPRSAAMTWFGNLDISWLTELPGGRKPIRTVLVQENDGATMRKVFIHARQRIDAGERVYVVCARIDDDTEIDETMDSFTDELFNPQTGEPIEDSNRRTLHSVNEISERLRSLPQFSGIEIQTLTGRDDDETKNAVMERFANGEAPVLVATTVIEVGVDVPQASCIIIFDADNYGLSQLHQLRGRVGRGGTQSWAFLVNNAQPGSVAEERLDVIKNSLDGAVIAQADLELRGAGDVLGDSQSGIASSFKLLRVVQDAEVIVHAREDAEALIEKDKNLSVEPELLGAVLDFERETAEYLKSS
ncbi:ATP-dependent DNA helicase RecG [Alloscardovia theropitheci]|uniref:ATP-dependent DNA helicase RecG n=1 Tax=Alloscardovia theropitheci TaxID=2496842 RepID=A0A4R0QT47_9BIFI|nr:ATP-dependent DNA helicase RecG [Alloscardovia theropitheci]TCD54678.1 ATP-dependent DNA helicase RecG [Alloscardovia theropitheci]